MADHAETSETNFMAGVAWACAFLRRADALNGGGKEHAQARFREGAQQAQLVPELLAALTARPELITGANAILVEYLCSGGENGAGPMNVDAYAAMTYDEFTREDDPDEHQGTSRSNVVCLPVLQRGEGHHG